MHLTSLLEVLTQHVIAYNSYKCECYLTLYLGQRECRIDVYVTQLKSRYFRIWEKGLALSLLSFRLLSLSPHRRHRHWTRSRDPVKDRSSDQRILFLLELPRCCGVHSAEKRMHARHNMRLISKFDIILAKMHHFCINDELRRYIAKMP